MQKSSTGSLSRIPFIFLAPAILIMFAVILFPVFDTLRLSFFDASFLLPGLKAPFLGMGNYLEVLRGPLFWQSLGITLKWTITSIILQFAVGFGLALLVHSQIPGRDGIRSAYMIPWMLPGALAAIMWKWMYHGSIGLLNYVLLKLGIISTIHPWLADSSTALWSAVLVNVWRGSPFFMVMLLGGLQTVPKDLYEAAEIDGANRFYSFIHITVPFLRPLINTLLIYGTVGAFNFLDIIMVLTGGGPAHHTMILPLYAWSSAFLDNRIGLASTISVLMCVVLCVFGLVVFAIKSMKRRNAV